MGEVQNLRAKLSTLQNREIPKTWQITQMGAVLVQYQQAM